MASFVFQVSPLSMNKPYERNLDRFGSGTMQGRQSTSVHMHPMAPAVLPVFIFRISGPYHYYLLSIGSWNTGHVGVLVFFCCVVVTMLTYVKTKYLHGLSYIILPMSLFIVVEPIHSVGIFMREQRVRIWTQWLQGLCLLYDSEQYNQALKNLSVNLLEPGPMEDAFDISRCLTEFLQNVIMCWLIYS
jgi:hypothetical protein